MWQYIVWPLSFNGSQKLCHLKSTLTSLRFHSFCIILEIFLLRINQFVANTQGVFIFTWECSEIGRDFIAQHKNRKRRLLYLRKYFLHINHTPVATFFYVIIFGNATYGRWLEIENHISFLIHIWKLSRLHKYYLTPYHSSSFRRGLSIWGNRCFSTEYFK